MGEEHEPNLGDESPPSKVARVSSPDESSDAGKVTTAVAPPLGLGLGLGIGGGGNSESSKGGGFTFMQMQEFHHQALIFKHMVAGIPVPVHLILPIWKSVAASYGPHHYPSFVGLGNLCYDFRNSMEPEPGRCRRTDGKKWRCSREVVPDQKYCDRHMHRGRNRSRKPVEGVGVTTTAPATATTELSIAVPGDGGPTKTDVNSSSSSNNVGVISSDVLGVEAGGGRIGLSPVSVWSGGAACKTGAS